MPSPLALRTLARVRLTTVGLMRASSQPEGRSHAPLAGRDIHPGIQGLQLSIFWFDPLRRQDD